MILKRLLIIGFTLLLCHAKVLAQDMDPIEFMMKGLWQMLQDTSELGRAVNAFSPQEHEKDVFMKNLQYAWKDFFEQEETRSVDTLGEEAFQYGEYQKAIDYFEEYAEACKMNKNEKGYRYAVRRLSAAYAYVSNYKRAVSYALQSLQMHLDAKDTIGISASYISLGMVHLSINEYETARKDLQKALDFSSGRDAEGERDAVYFLGNVSLSVGEYDDAVNYFMKARELDRKADNEEKLIDDCTSLSFTYFTGPRPDSLKAIRALYEVTNHVKLNGMQAKSVSAIVKIGSMLRMLGKYEDALQSLRVVTEVGYPVANNRELAKAKALQALLYADLGQFEKAYKTFIQYQALSDSLFSESKNREVKKLEVEYETAKKEKALAKSEEKRREKELVLAVREKELLQAQVEKSEREKQLALSQSVIQQGELQLAEKEKQRAASELVKAKREQQMVYLGSGALLLVLILSGIYYNRQRNLQQRVAIETLKAAKSQMSRHFTFNTLESIRQVVQEKPELADNYIRTFSAFIRGVLENSDNPETTLEQELAELKNYVEFERIRTNNSFDFSLDLGPDIDPTRMRVPSLILQPIVENSILHGFNKLDYKGQLNLSITRRNGILVCNVRDNGKGRSMNPLTLEPGRKSVGTKITRERLRVYNNLQNQRARFEIKDLKPGVEVTFTLPEVFETA